MWYPELQWTTQSRPDACADTNTTMDNCDRENEIVLVTGARSHVEMSKLPLLMRGTSTESAAAGCCFAACCSAKHISKLVLRSSEHVSTFLLFFSFSVLSILFCFVLFPLVPVGRRVYLTKPFTLSHLPWPALIRNFPQQNPCLKNDGVSDCKQFNTFITSNNWLVHSPVMSEDFESPPDSGSAEEA